MKNVTSLLAGVAVAGLLVTAPSPVAASSKPLVFGIVPQQSASRLARVWVPVFTELTRRTGIRFKFATAKDIPTFESCLARQAYDISYMNPYHYVVFHDVSGYQALARQKKKRLRGILVARKDSPVETLRDLQGHSVAFPSPAAFGASVIPRALMQQQGVGFDPVYVKSHDSVYRAVADGHQIAGGGVLRTWKTMAPEVKARLRVFYETDAYTPHAVAVRSDVTARNQQKLLTALLDLETTAPQLLDQLGMKGFEPGADEDWDDVRALNLSKSQTDIVDQDTAQCHSG